MTFSLFLYMLWSRQALLGNKPFCWSSLCFLIISIVWSYIYELWSLEWQGYFSITCLIIYLICLFIFKWISKLKVSVIFQSTSIFDYFCTVINIATINFGDISGSFPLSLYSKSKQRNKWISTIIMNENLSLMEVKHFIHWIKCLICRWKLQVEFVAQGLGFDLNAWYVYEKLQVLLPWV